jgi:hypothetical protein
MRRNLAAAVFALAWPLLSQTVDSPELRKALDDAAKVRALVEAGALPRKALVDAEMVLAEARDEETLRYTLYGEIPVGELTGEQAESMLKAAQGLVDRQQTQLDRAEELAREGALAPGGLDPYREDLARRRKTLAMAGERAGLFAELVEMARLEKQLEEALIKAPEEVRKIAERFDGNGVFLNSQFRVVKLEFERHFQTAMPVSANGDTPLHRSMGFDHTGRIDVALHPDSKEGAWLRTLLKQLSIPYFAFRGAMPGKSTGSHIHIGPPSGRFRASN